MRSNIHGVNCCRDADDTSRTSSFSRTRHTLIIKSGEKEGLHLSCWCGTNQDGLGGTGSGERARGILCKTCVSCAGVLVVLVLVLVLVLEMGPVMVVTQWW